MFSEHYEGWRKSRMDGITKYISCDYFKNKTLLEVGCGYADIGNLFYELGADVTSSDARNEHLEIAQIKYPHLKILNIDADNDFINDNYDIILHWGLLYHLNPDKLETHLENVSLKCDVLLLETEVSDSDDETHYIVNHEIGYDQAYNNETGVRPSEKYVEKLLEKNGFYYKIIKDPILNSGFHRYDWNINNYKTWSHGLRRFWICWKNVDSPLIDF
jgi:hypothetical protein